MKKFFFPLDKVLDYKEQVLDGLKAEHARILMKVRECERAIEELEQLHRDCTAEFRKNKLNGIKISEIHTYENYLEALGVKIRIKQDQLEKLKLREEAKRNEVVEAKKETSTLDKLKEKKREEGPNIKKEKK